MIGGPAPVVVAIAAVLSAILGLTEVHAQADEASPSFTLATSHVFHTSGWLWRAPRARDVSLTPARSPTGEHR